MSEEDDDAAGQEDGEEDQLGGADENTGHLDDSTNQAAEQDVIGEKGCTPSKRVLLS